VTHIEKSFRVLGKRIFFQLINPKIATPTVQRLGYSRFLFPFSYRIPKQSTYQVTLGQTSFVK